MEPPLSDADERGVGSGHRYNPGRPPSPIREETTTEKPKPGRATSPTAQQRKAEQAEKAKHEQQHQQNADPEDAPGVRQNLYGNATINNFTRPALFMGEQLRDPHAKNPNIEEENARREGELRGMRDVEQEKAILKSQSNQELAKAKKEFVIVQAELKAETAIHAERILDAHKLLPATLERDKQMANRDIELALHKRESLLRAVPREKQVAEAKEEATVKFEVQKYHDELLVNHKLQNRDRENLLAVRDGITNAISSLAAKEYLRNHDYDQTVRGKFILLAKEVAVRLAIEAVVDALKQGGSYCKSKFYQAFINLPFSHCRSLKEQEEMIAQFDAIQARTQMLRAEKRDLQQILDHDALLLKKEEDNIRYFKKRVKETQDEKEKEHLQTVVTVLQQQHDENRLNHALLLKLNADQQPHFQRIMVENQRKINKQKREAQEAAQAAGA
jgi:hypothetical protein